MNRQRTANRPTVPAGASTRPTLEMPAVEHLRRLESQQAQHRVDIEALGGAQRPLCHEHLRHRPDGKAHIVSLNIDDPLSSGRADPDLVERIARLEQKGKVRRNYSFATKYCSFHRPDDSIYDSLVVEILNGLLKQGEAFDTFEPGETWSGDYGVYCRSVAGFREHFGLDEFSIRDIDKYLWMVAKERRAAST